MVNMILSNEHIKTYKKKGWVVLKKALDKKEISKYKDNIFSYLKNNHKKFNGRNINYFYKKQSFNEISSFHKLQENKKIKKFSEKGIVSKIAQKLLNKKPELRASELFIKKKGSGKPTPIHQDAYYWNVKNNQGLTIWVALTDSNKKNGSVFYFDSSHKYGVFKHKSSFLNADASPRPNPTEYLLSRAPRPSQTLLLLLRPQHTFHRRRHHHRCPNESRPFQRIAAT